MKSRGLWLGAVTLGAFAVGILAGAVSLRPSEVWEGLVNPASPSASIVRELRVPRVLLAFAVGGSLGVCGGALQAMIRNPLADPYLLGLSGGSGLGAVLAISLGGGGRLSVPLAAFAGAMLAIALVYRLSLVEGRRMDVRVLLLAGVVVGAFAVAVMSAVIALSDSSQLRNAFLWLLGGFGGASWQALGTFTLYATIPLAILFANARALDLLALGEDSAQHLGVELERTKRLVYLSTGLLTAVGVSTCGIIGFVGLVVPHAVRGLWGPLHRTLLPVAFLAGGAFLVLADALARTVVRPLELPVGVVTALVGVPLFALLLRRTLA